MRLHRFPMTGLLLLAGLLGWGLALREPPPGFAPAWLEVTGARGLLFQGIIQTNGRTCEVGGTVPSVFHLGQGRFTVRLWMTGGPGRLTNTVYEESVPKAGAESGTLHECVGFERTSRGVLNINAYPSNAVLNMERPL
ncbi:MAG: hypothetical protein RJA22_2683 [Verrucomicrobiota bacterium]|jgi:hypothetical protein